MNKIPALHSPVLVPYIVMLTLRVQALALFCFAVVRWVLEDYEGGLWRWYTGFILFGVQAIMSLLLGVKSNASKGQALQ